MAITTSGTSITFNDATTQTTAGVTSVGAGTGISSSGGLTPTISNTGVTSVAAGTGISVSASTGSVTISASGTGTVTSVATGNGLSGGTITTSGTLSLAAPSFNSVGSYCYVTYNSNNGSSVSAGSNYSSGNNSSPSNNTITASVGNGQTSTTLSGTWKWMASNGNCNSCITNLTGLAVRVS